MSELQSSLVAWININNLSHTATEILELSNCILLTEFMKQVAPDYFNTLDLVTEDSAWPSKLNNLKQFTGALDSFYQNVLKIPADTVADDLDLAAMARNDDRNELMRLIELVMGAAVSCDEKETYIARIMGLEEHDQTQLMVFIQSVMQKITEGESSKEKIDIQSIRHENRRMTMEMSNLKEEFDDMEISLKSRETEREELVSKVEELQDKLDALENPSSGQTLSTINVELEAKIDQKDNEIDQLSKQIKQMEKAHDTELSRLKDEIDFANEKIISLSKLENTLDIYKKKLEEMNDLKQKHTELSGMYKDQTERLKKYEDESSASSGVKNALNYYKDLLTQEKEKVANLTVQLENEEKMKQKLVQNNEETEQKRKISESKAKELQRELDQQRFSLNMSGEQEGLSISVHDYEERLRHLEQENRELKEQNADTLVAELNEQVDSLLKAKSSAEFNLTNTAEEKGELFKTIQELQTALNSQKTSMSSSISELNAENKVLQTENMSLKEKLEILGKDSARLEMENREIEKLKTDNDSMITELKGLYHEKDEINKKYMDAKEEVLKIQSSLQEKEAFLKAGELEVSKIEAKLKEAQEAERLAQREIEMIKDKTNTDTTESNEEKIRTLEMEKEAMKLNSEIATLKLGMREKDDIIQQTINDTKRNEEEMKLSLEQKENNLSNTYQEEVRKRDSTIQQFEHEMEYLEKTKNEQIDDLQKENRLLSSVIHTLGQEIFGMNRAPSAGKSFLDKKRN